MARASQQNVDANIGRELPLVLRVKLRVDLAC
jgi:hypothetical protein